MLNPPYTIHSDGRPLTVQRLALPDCLPAGAEQAPLRWRSSSAAIRFGVRWARREGRWATVLGPRVICWINPEGEVMT